MNFSAFKANFGIAVRDRRLELELNQAELADKVGTDQGNISRIERGEQGFEAETLLKLSAALDIPLSTLFAIVEGRHVDKRFSTEVDSMALGLTRMATEDRARYEAIKTLISGASTNQ